ncbi:MAG: hypothetical protein HY645_08005 [Acidobacteria bacterium]|nr:hypothetical protein [Acidobacteriota bacterium]
MKPEPRRRIALILMGHGHRLAGCEQVEAVFMLGTNMTSASSLKERIATSPMILLVLGSLAGQPVAGQGNSALLLSTVEQIRQDAINVPCADGERMERARQLMQRMDAVVSVDKLKRVENLVARKVGGAETVIIGAHYDKTSSGCGAVDNWSGIVALAHRAGFLAYLYGG